VAVRGTLKDSIEVSETTALSAHRVIALTMMVLGAILVGFSAATVMTHGSTLGAWLSAGVGISLIVIGLALLVTELLERWLSGGQTALVDGLQAG